MGDSESKLKAGVLINFLPNFTGSRIEFRSKRISPLQPSGRFLGKYISLELVHFFPVGSVSHFKSLPSKCCAALENNCSFSDLNISVKIGYLGIIGNILPFFMSIIP